MKKISDFIVDETASALFNETDYKFLLKLKEVNNAIAAKTKLQFFFFTKQFALNMKWLFQGNVGSISYEFKFLKLLLSAKVQLIFTITMYRLTLDI